MKRFISVFLLLSLLFALFAPTTVFATENDIIAENSSISSNGGNSVANLRTSAGLQAVDLITDNKIGEATAYEGGTLDDDLAYSNKIDNLTTPPIFTVGTEINTEVVYVTQKVGGYNGKKTVVWEGLSGNLSKGEIVYQADLTLYPQKSQWSSIHNGFIVATVDGQYVMVGLGLHAAKGTNNYVPITRINGNDADQASVTTKFLGASSEATGPIVEATEDGTTVRLTVVLTQTSIKSYIDGVLAQTFDITEKIVAPKFAWGWGSGNEADNISNVCIAGEGVVVGECSHSYDDDFDPYCNLCGTARAKITGVTGDCTWTLYDKTALVISGNGAMGDYETGATPWGGEITKVRFENSVTYIGESAFHGCELLESVTVPGSVNTIGNGAFVGCTSLENITLSEGIKTIEDYAFLDCSSLESITIPSSTTCIGKRVFEGTNLSFLSVEKENSVYHSDGNCIIETASKTLVAGCKTSIIPTDNSVTIIGESAFFGCTSLERIIISDNITEIGDSAFYNCINLNEAFIGAGVQTVGDLAFYQCESITNLNFSDEITSIGERAFQNCKSLKTVKLPKNITEIKFGTFASCTSLESITIPKGVTEIKTAAFYNCINLKEITIPDSLGIVDQGAFYDCSSLQSVMYEGSDAQKQSITISSYNEPFTSAVWDYDVCQEHLYDDKYDATCNLCGATRAAVEKVAVGDIEIEMMQGDLLPTDKKIYTKYILGWKNPDSSKYDGLTYVSGLVAEFVETKMMKVKYQCSSDLTVDSEKTSVRFITSVDQTERYKKVGWLFSLTDSTPNIGETGVSQRETSTVYNSIKANGKVLSATDVYGADYSKYLSVFEIRNIPKSAFNNTIYVRSYVVMEDGRIVYGDYSQINIADVLSGDNFGGNPSTDTDIKVETDFDGWEDRWH